MCAGPCVIAANLCSFLFVVTAKKQMAILQFCLVVVLWPFLLLARWVIEPVVALESRTDEYEADAAAAEAGYGAGLLAVLEEEQVFEGARTGWQAILTRTHPPTEYRIEALTDLIAGERPLHGSSRKRRAVAAQ